MWEGRVSLQRRKIRIPGFLHKEEEGIRVKAWRAATGAACFLPTRGKIEKEKIETQMSTPLPSNSFTIQFRTST